MSAFENVDFPEPAGPVTNTAYLIVEYNQGPTCDGNAFDIGSFAFSVFEVKGVVADEK